ncbi:MAG: replicative DNA helicase [Verrucomicrobia bacterium]|nr:replicative DNA helicase [Verrucomicrobiota bacterium]MDA1202987.1 replicative DNA helicase [Verrucomicrobiota bacterium]
MTPPVDLTAPAARRTPAPRRNGAAKAAGAAPDAHRPLPQNVEAERGLLGSILLSPREVLNDCAEQITEEAFYSPAHGTIFRVLVEMWSANQQIDVITLTNRLRDLNLLDAVGGPGAVTELFGFVPTAANAPHYLDIVLEKSLLRRMIMACTSSAARCYEEQGDVPQLLDDVEREIFTIGETRFRKTEPDMRDEVFAALENIEKMYQQRGRISGLATGFTIFDQMTDGLHPGEMIIVAARPSMGKTALAMNIVEHVALNLEAPKPVGVFSLEMSTQQLVQRMLCSRARVNMKKIRSGMLARAEHGKLNDAAAALSESSIFIDDTASLTILELRAKARRMRDRHRIELIAIDYLQLCRSTSRRGQDNRQIEIAEISSGIKALAKELEIPIIVLAQLNRQPEQRGGGKPRMSDLRESGSLEQDADVVALLVRPEVYEEDEDARSEMAGKAELLIAKQRNGPIGEIPLTFIKEYTRFENAAFDRPSGSEE